MWQIKAQYGTGRTIVYTKPNRTSARNLKHTLEKNARLAGVPYDVRIKS